MQPISDPLIHAAPFHSRPPDPAHPLEQKRYAAPRTSVHGLAAVDRQLLCARKSACDLLFREARIDVETDVDRPARDEGDGARVEDGARGEEGVRREGRQESVVRGEVIEGVEEVRGFGVDEAVSAQEGGAVGSSDVFEDACRRRGISREGVRAGWRGRECEQEDIDGLAKLDGQAEEVGTSRRMAAHRRGERGQR